MISRSAAGLGLSSVFIKPGRTGRTGRMGSAHGVDDCVTVRLSWLDSFSGLTL